MTHWTIQVWPALVVVLILVVIYLLIQVDTLRWRIKNLSDYTGRVDSRIYTLGDRIRTLETRR